MNIVLVSNPGSGSALPRRELSRRAKKHGITVTKHLNVQDNLKAEITKLASGTIVAVYGGDGTVNSVAGELVGRDLRLAPLPGGTLNHFAKDLGVPTDLDEALAGLSNATERRVDIARVNDLYFVNNASIGLYPASLHTRDLLKDYVGKWPSAFIAAERAFIRFRTYEVTLNNETFHTPFVFIGNNVYSWKDGGRRSVSAGKLGVMVARTRSRLALLKVIVSAPFGLANYHDEFEEFTAKKFVIRSTKNVMSVAHDGEVSRLETPLAFEVKPKALRVLVARKT